MIDQICERILRFWSSKLNRMTNIWPRLKRSLFCDARKSKSSKSRKSKKANPFSSSGLDKFATVLQEMQAKKNSSLVERTASSVAAARSLSQSAQEWTATRLSDYTESLSFVKPCCKEVSTAEKSQTTSEVAQTRETSSRVVQSVENLVFRQLQRELAHNRAERNSQVTVVTEEVGSSAKLNVGSLLVKTGRCTKRMRGLQRTSTSAFVVLVALGAFISNRFGRISKSLVPVLTFNAVIRVWRKGKLYAWFMFSSIALNFLTPLRSCLTDCPRRLSLLSRKFTEIGSEVAHSQPLMLEASRKPGIEAAREEQHSSLENSVLPLEPAPSDAMKQRAPLVILLPIDNSISSEIESIPPTVVYKKMTRSRRLAKKVSSKLEKLKFRSSTPFSSSLPVLSISESSTRSGTSEPASPSSHASAATSPDSRRHCPFSRLHKAKPGTSTDITDVEGDESSSHNKKSTGSRKCCLRREKSSEDVCGKRSRLTKMLPSDTIAQSNAGDTTTCTHTPTPTSNPSPPLVDDSFAPSNSNSWMVVGLLVTLLFLLVGRVPAIMATSLFLVVVSNTHHDRVLRRSRGRDTRTLEAARKLHTSPPRGRHNPPNLLRRSSAFL